MRKINHLSFIDDIKLYAESREKLQDLITTVKKYGDDIIMSFGLDKCAIINIKKGKQNYMREPLDDIKELTAEDSYKYLGLHQNI